MLAQTAKKGVAVKQGSERALLRDYIAISNTRSANYLLSGSRMLRRWPSGGGLRSRCAHDSTRVVHTLRRVNPSIIFSIVDLGLLTALRCRAASDKQQRD